MSILVLFHTLFVILVTIINNICYIFTDGYRSSIIFVQQSKVLYFLSKICVMRPCQWYYNTTHNMLQFTCANITYRNKLNFLILRLFVVWIIITLYLQIGRKVNDINTKRWKYKKVWRYFCIRRINK